MPLLKLFTMMKCEVLNTFLESYVTLTRLQKVRIYGCSMILGNVEKIERVNTNVEGVTLSTKETEEVSEKFTEMLETFKVGCMVKLETMDFSYFWKRNVDLYKISIICNYVSWKRCIELYKSPVICNYFFGRDV